MNIEILPVEGLPVFQPGDDLAQEICKRMEFVEDDILCIASSVYSKSKGYIRMLDEITPSEKAKKIAKMCGEDERFIQVVLEQTEEVILEDPFVLSRMSFGHVGVRAGVDNSNVEKGIVIILPPDPMAAAEEIRGRLREIAGKNIRVIITDTCGRPFRRGQTGVAIGWAGMDAICDFRGDHDLFGRVLEITEEAVADEIAAFSNFIMGESNRGIPAVVFRNCPQWEGHNELYFTPEKDITMKAYRKL